VQGESLLERGGEGDDAILPPLPWVIRMRQVSGSTSAIRIRTSLETRTPEYSRVLIKMTSFARRAFQTAS
jgi:hypothetical protein